MLRPAFNAITRLHSRPAQLKRLGSPDLYSPCRITPANYFRFLRGPEHIDVKGREFIIPLSTMAGSFSQQVIFDGIPSAGYFKIRYNLSMTGAFNWTSDEEDIQEGLRLLPGLQNVEVLGLWDGFQVNFPGFSTRPLPLEIRDSSLVGSEGEPIVEDVADGYQAWTTPLKRGDKILDPTIGSMTVDEVVDIVDLGAQIMGFRVRCE